MNCDQIVTIPLMDCDGKCHLAGVSEDHSKRLPARATPRKPLESLIDAALRGWRT